jgi:hypothetical protein
MAADYELLSMGGSTFAGLAQKDHYVGQWGQGDSKIMLQVHRAIRRQSGPMPAMAGPAQKYLFCGQPRQA